MACRVVSVVNRQCTYGQTVGGATLSYCFHYSQSYLFSLFLQISKAQKHVSTLACCATFADGLSSFNDCVTRSKITSS